MLSPQKRMLILANNNRLLCSAIQLIFAKDPSFDQVVMQNSAEVLGAELIEHQFDFIIIFAMPPVSALIPRLAKLGNGTAKRLLVLNSNDKFAISSLTALPVEGVISTEACFTELQMALKVIADGALYLSHLLTASFTSLNSDNSLALLSQKEHDIVTLLAIGHSHATIAEKLNISPKTVYSYKSRIYTKLNIRNDLQLLQVMWQL
jgi:two-component system, NarL family, response regulator NreC